MLHICTCNSDCVVFLKPVVLLNFDGQDKNLETKQKVSRR